MYKKGCANVGNYSEAWRDGGNGDMVIINDKKTIMSKVGIMMTKMLDKDTQKLVKAELINGNLDLTDEGTKALLAILFTANKSELVTIAEDIIAENEKVSK